MLMALHGWRPNDVGYLDFLQMRMPVTKDLTSLYSLYMRKPITKDLTSQLHMKYDLSGYIWLYPSETADREQAPD